MSNFTNESMTQPNSSARDFKNKIHSPQTKAESILKPVERSLVKSASEAVKQAGEYLSTGRKVVAENPGKSVAVALVAGMTLGGLATLFYSRKK